MKSINMYLNDVYETHVKLVERYIDILPSGRAKDMCYTFLERGNKMPPDKQGRWVGYIQHELINMGLSTVDKERFITRPIFHTLYSKYGLSKDTIDVELI